MFYYLCIHSFKAFIAMIVLKGHCHEMHISKNFEESENDCDEIINRLPIVTNSV